MAAAPLIKAVFHGSETYIFASRRVRVGPGEILVIATETIYAPFDQHPGRN
ncbi:hypothetical protein [Shinella sp.]|uniref:hypothetical protein n=1 Tax=Shinella sp. TaxID=1870904 RepID=UPI003F71AEFB